ncbi:MAG: GNAT family protein [Candidatus Hinthialibacter antarcticus]|nr:GNAT family protein [Candidatus Hinthialibacter antarcticus]
MHLFSLGDGIELKVMNSEHDGALFDLVEANREHLRVWLPWVDRQKTLEDCQNFLKSLEEHFASNKAMHCGIWVESELAGVVGMDRIDWPNKTAEIGYWIGKGHEGKGLVTRSCQFLVEFAFMELKLNRLEIRCAPNNLRSRGIPERLGFIIEGRLKQAEWLYDHYEDHIFYALLADEWLENHDPQLDVIPKA